MTANLRLVILGLVVLVALALIGIVVLVALDKSAPDVLGYLITTAIGGLTGILVPAELKPQQQLKQRP